jgi:uncharacterized membrane protein
MTALLWLRIVHFVGLLLWVSGLTSMATVLIGGARSKLAGVLADLGATLALISGIYTALDRGLFRQPWLHIKLTLVAALLGVHIVLRFKTRRGNASGAGALLGTTLLLAVAIVAMIVLRPLAR